MPEIKIFEHLRDIDRNSWNACFAGEVENYEYLLSVENAGIKGFCFAYITAWENNIIIAAMPAFITDYSLDTTLQGTGKKVTSAISATFPNLLKIKLACLGSPCTEAGIIGFYPQVNMDKKPELLRIILKQFETYANAQGCKLIGIKDIPETMQEIWQLAIKHLKYAEIPGMPTAYMNIDFASIDEYMATKMSHTTRKNMRRKLKATEHMEIKIAHSIDEVLPEIMQLYKDTKSRSEWQFEELTEKYFTGVLANMPDNSFCVLYYLHSQLLAANIMVHNNRTLVDKFFCMDAETGRKYNLYFLSWFTNVNICLERGFTSYKSGQEGYENKLRLGSELIRNQMYFKHCNILAHGLLKLVSPLLAADETIKEAA